MVSGAVDHEKGVSRDVSRITRGRGERAGLQAKQKRSSKGRSFVGYSGASRRRRKKVV